MTNSRTAPEQASISNRPLSRMSPEDFDLLSSHLDYGCFPRGEVLVKAHAPLAQVYFPESGIASMIVRSPEGHQVEVGLVGREGFIHPALLHGVDAIPYRVEVQIACEAYVMPASALIDAVEASSRLRHLLTLFGEALTVQSVFTSLIYAAHDIGERLARWLLMCHDRCGDQSIVLTHEFLSIMLAVRRPTVTNTIHILEGNGFIRAERGIITIRDRARLEE